MDPTQNKMPAAPSSARWLISCLVVLHAASACGRVRAGDTGSETHWLVSCDSDLECGEGSCECGVCSQACVTMADCGALGIAGVECLPTAGACDSGGASGGLAVAGGGLVCLLPCAQDVDCAELGTEASCENQRCELPPGNSVVGGSSSASLEIPTLCDGSEEIRVVNLDAGGFVDSSFVFVASYGFTFFAIDGQCRFWQGRGPDGSVYSGSLSNQEAQAFARAIGFGHLSDYSLFRDYECDDGGGQLLWTPEGHISCGCDCGNNPDAPASWRAAFNATSEARVNLLVSGQIIRGPAQLALVPMNDPLLKSGAPAWPLERAPTAREIVPGPVVGGDLPQLQESVGALITDPAELFNLRGLRADYSGPVAHSASTPVLWTNPDTQVVEGFYMLLRDEVPASVKAALETARAP